MGKKNFNEGLEDIFKNPSISSTEEVLVRSGRVSDGTDESSSASGTAVEAAGDRKKSYKKNFTYDLSNLLDDAFQESKDASENMVKEKETNKGPKKRIKKVPLTGINALIRRTLDTDYEGIDSRDFKRITFICDRDKIARLKKIAKTEKLYLKDILSDLIDRYIKNFDTSKAN